MSNLVLQLNTPELQKLQPSKSELIKATFDPMVATLSNFEQDFNTIIEEAKEGITQDLIDKTKRLRLDIRKVRIDTGKLKDKQKEYIKLEDKAIMAVHNIIVWAVTEKEDKLLEIEKYHENQEKLRLSKLQEDRVALLSEYVEDAENLSLSTMADDVWEAYLTIKKKAHLDRLEAERLAEEARVQKEKEEAEERLRIQEENERLKKEAEAREKELEEERKIALAKQLEADKKAKEEREKLEAELKASRDAKAKVEAEQAKAKALLEAEIKAKKEAEIKAKIEEEARVQAELSKGDEAKIQDLITDLVNLKSKYQFESDKNKAKYVSVQVLLDKVVEFIKK